eukprot:1955611-Amphidinium_carterae.1
MATWGPEAISGRQLPFQNERPTCQSALSSRESAGANGLSMREWKQLPLAAWAYLAQPLSLVLKLKITVTSALH